MAKYVREPRAYELMAILLPELADESLTAQIDRVAGFITDVNGSIKETLTDSPWGRRRLAYTIRFNGVDYRDGIYVIWHFDLEPTRVGELERELKLDTSVIRYLLVHDDPKWGPKNGGNQPQGEGSEEASGRPAAAPAEATAASEPEATGATAEEAPATEVETPAAEAPAEETPATEAETPATEATVADETSTTEETASTEAGEATEEKQDG